MVPWLAQRREEEADGRPQCRGAGTDLCSLVTVTEAKGTAWNCDRGGSG